MKRSLLTVVVALLLLGAAIAESQELNGALGWAVSTIQDGVEKMASASGASEEQRFDVRVKDVVAKFEGAKPAEPSRFGGTWKEVLWTSGWVEGFSTADKAEGILTPAGTGEIMIIPRAQTKDSQLPDTCEIDGRIIMSPIDERQGMQQVFCSRFNGSMRFIKTLRTVHHNDWGPGFAPMVEIDDTITGVCRMVDGDQMLCRITDASTFTTISYRGFVRVAEEKREDVKTK